MTPKALDDLARAILPLCFLSEHAEVHYGTKGTGFLIRRQGVLWLATAAHAVEGDRGYVRVPRDEDANEWMTFGTSSALEAREGVEDSAAADLAVFRVLDSEADVAPVIDLDTLPIAKTMTPGDQVWFAGYPAGPNHIDYDGESPKQRQQRERVTAWYDGPDSSLFMHIILIGFLMGATDGFSGSPVFLKHDGAWSFAGVLTRASGGEWGFGRFIDADTLLYLTDKSYRECPSGTEIPSR
jgi:hypothetical protein